MGVSLIYGSIKNATFPYSVPSRTNGKADGAYRKTIRFTGIHHTPHHGRSVRYGRSRYPFAAERQMVAFHFLSSNCSCLGGCFTILTAINNNFIKVNGRSDGILKIEYYKIAFTVAVVLLTYREDVLTMVAGLVVTRLLVYIIK